MAAYHNVSGSDHETKTIVLLGKIGAGKSTIARHIFKEDAERFPKVDSVKSTTREADLYDGVHSLSGGTKVRVIIMDTSSQLSGGAKYPIITKPLQLSKVYAIFFVLKCGRVTREECGPLDEIIQTLEQANMLNICHLVITACEGKDEAIRRNIAATYKDDPMTQKICRCVKQIHFVGFPELSELQPRMRDLYAEGIEKDEMTIRRIVESEISTESMFDLKAIQRAGEMTITVTTTAWYIKVFVRPPQRLYEAVRSLRCQIM